MYKHKFGDRNVEQIKVAGKYRRKYLKIGYFSDEDLNTFYNAIFPYCDFFYEYNCRVTAELSYLEQYSENIESSALQLS